jgi:tetratricopeptide (TPR) repeat protein/transcriptional regulator with XRE-family HTH domain
MRVSEEVTFGDLLRSHRHAAELTIEELSSASGVSVRAIGDMERGRSRGPQRRTVSALADALGLSSADHEALTGAAKAGRPRASADSAGVCELPRGIPDFTGRRDELEGLVRLAERATDDGPAAIATISGGPGLGKTALVVHAAYRLAGHFPDGSFFVDLRGMDAAPIGPGVALTRLLRGFGVPEGRIPQDEEERAGHYRALLRRRRSLIVLDNATDEAQVRPLLPGGGGSLAVVTSRRSLAGLEGVHHVPLAEMASVESVRLLRTIVGAERTAVEAGELDEVAALCGNLPLAMRIAGNRLLSRPGWTVRHLAGRLADEERRLETLSAGDLHVGAAFALSYRHLSVPARELFRRLALVPGPDFGVALGAVLAQAGLDDTEDALEELVELGLLQSPYVGRYRLHDLVRLFARARLAEEETEGGRSAAHSRMNDWLLDTATVAGRWFEPDYGAPPADWHGLEPLATPEEAQTWLETESENWLAAMRTAAAEGRYATVVAVGGAMHWFSDRWIHWGHWPEVYGMSRDAAHAMGDRAAEAVHLNYVAWACAVCEGRYDESVEHSLRALELARDAGDLKEQAWSLNYAAWALVRITDFDRAVGYARQAVALFQEVGDWDGYPQGMGVLGDCLRGLGRLEETLRHYLAMVDTLRDPSYGASPNIRQLSLGLTLGRVGRAYLELDRLPEAAEAYREAIPLLRGQGILNAVAIAAQALAAVFRRLDRPADARAALEESLTCYLAIGETNLATEIRKELADLEA